MRAAALAEDGGRRTLLLHRVEREGRTLRVQDSGFWRHKNFNFHFFRFSPEQESVIEDANLKPDFERRKRKNVSYPDFFKT